MNLTKKNALLALVALTTALATGCSAEPAGDDDLAEELGTTRQELSAAFTLRARHSGKCLDVEGASLESGARVNQYSCHGGENQRWVRTWQ